MKRRIVLSLGCDNEQTMNVNTSILSQYPADGSKYVDPMYVPYQRTRIKIGSGWHDVNTWKRNGGPAMVHPDHLRQGWGMDFLRIHPNDPCPADWTDAMNGHCTRVHQESHESTFYTPDQFTVEYQYHGGYTTDPRDGTRETRLAPLETAPPFQNRSVNPHTGRYVEYHIARPHPASARYGGNPSRHSYLGRP